MITGCLPFSVRNSLQEMSISYPSLTTIYYYMSGECNLHCRHCWIAPHFSNQIKTFLSWDELRPIFVDALDLGLEAVKLTGGEPLLHPEFREILTGLNLLGLKTAVETNGTLLDEALGVLIQETETFISISLDGSRAETHENLRKVKGSFDQTLRAANILQRLAINYQVIFSLHRGNAAELKEVVQLARELGAGSLKINPIAVEQRAGQMGRQGELFGARELLDLFKEARALSDADFTIHFDLPPAFYPLIEAVSGQAGICGIHNLLGVLSNGTASICGIGEQVEALNFGNLLNQGVKSIWKDHPVLQDLRIKIPAALGGVCSACIHAAYCLGKCAAMNYYEAGSLYAGHSFCQEAYELGLFPENRLFRLPKDPQRVRSC